MLHILERWKQTKSEMAWQIAYRKDAKGSLLIDRNTPFNRLILEDGTWAADPFLFAYDNQIYLFYELFIENQHKGVIAFSKWNGSNFNSPEIALEEAFHLSFPCIFSINEIVYMIPETGSQNQLILYRCYDFPSKWNREKTLLEIHSPSDSIVIFNNDGIYVLVSVLQESASSAQNKLYKLDIEKMELCFCCEQNQYGEKGFRNAGLLFEENNLWYRPGQNCEGQDYGKSIILWENIMLSEDCYEEKFFGEISVKDIFIDGKYDGMHTYNKMNTFEVIDLRIIRKNSFLKRIFLFCKQCLSYINRRVRKC